MVERYKVASLMAKFANEIYTAPIDETEVFIKTYGTVFNTYPFLAAVGGDYKCIVAREENSGNIAGVLPLVKSTRFGLKAYHIPSFAHQFGPVLCDLYKDQAIKVLECLLLPLSKEKHLDFKIKIEDDDIIPFKDLRFNLSPTQTHIFPAQIEYTAALLSKDKARDVNRLLRKKDAGEITVVENHQSNLHVILKMWEETANRANFDPHLTTLNSIFHSDIAHYSNVVFASDGTPLAGAYCPYDRENMYHLIGASTRNNDAVLKRSNMLSLFLAVKSANQRKLHFDFEGSNIPGIALFYRMMGGKSKVIYRAQKTLSIYYHGLRAIKAMREERSI